MGTSWNMGYGRCSCDRELYQWRTFLRPAASLSSQHQTNTVEEQKRASDPGWIAGQNERGESRSLHY